MLIIFTQIALALKYSHDKGVIHKRIKSRNVFLTSEGIVKLQFVDLEALRPSHFANILMVSDCIVCPEKI